MRADNWQPTMAELKAAGVNIVAPPIWYMLTLDDDGMMIPSPYAPAAK